MPQPAAMQVVSSTFPMPFTTWAIILAHPPHQGRANRTGSSPGVILRPPISTEDGRKAMSLRLKCPLFLPETQFCGTVHSTAQKNKYVGKAYCARALRLCSTSPKFLGSSLHEFTSCSTESFIGLARMVVQIIYRYRLTQDALKRYLQEKFPTTAINVQVSKDG